MQVKLPARVQVTDVVGRDGFQMERDFIPSTAKVRIIDLLSASGLQRIEATSFVHPKAVPQLRDAAEVLAAITRRPGVTYTCLVPNVYGARRAVESRVDEVNVVLSASPTHNQRNLNMSVEQSLQNTAAIVELVRPHAVQVNASVATAFGCPFEGEVSAARVLDLVERLLALGADTITLADTTGMAHPRQVTALVGRVLDRFPELGLTLHFHNTRGMGLCNVLAGLLAGVTRYDASLGGLGGCPFAPGATGNVCTEDLAHMLEEMGIDTGIDLDALIAAARELERTLGRTLPGQVMKAGKRSQLHPVAATC
jgi:hydroxymethylglutaryl-CoA lyase